MELRCGGESRGTLFRVRLVLAMVLAPLAMGVVAVLFLCCEECESFVIIGYGKNETR